MEERSFTQAAGTAWMAASGDKRHRIRTELHHHGEMGGQGISPRHTAGASVER